MAPVEILRGRRPGDVIWILCLGFAGWQAGSHAGLPGPEDWVARRIPDVPTLEQQLATWLYRRNKHHLKVDCRFTTNDPRIKLKTYTPYFRRFRALAPLRQSA